jgi:hypothetical protein
VCVCVCNKLFIIYINNMGNKGSRSRSRGRHGLWSHRAPKSIGDRNALLHKCGRRCFLGTRKTFPICPRLGAGSGSGSCKIDRRGVAAAYSRAREWVAITARKKRTSVKAARAHRTYTAVAHRAKVILGT